MEAQEKATQVSRVMKRQVKAFELHLNRRHGDKTRFTAHRGHHNPHRSLAEKSVNFHNKRTESPNSEEAFEELLENPHTLNDYSCHEEESKAEEHQDPGPETDPQLQPFSEAILRWQLRKGRRTSPFNTSTIGVVDENGAFVNRVSLAQSARENRLLGRCFLRLKNNYISSRRRHQALTAVVEFRKGVWFESWLKAFYACRFHRLQLISRVFARWTEYREVQLEKDFVNAHADNFRKFFVFRKTWERLRRNAKAGAEARTMKDSALSHEKCQQKFKAWTVLSDNRAIKVAKKSAMNAAKTFYRASSGKRVLALLKLNVNDKQNDRYASLRLERSKAKRCLQKWNSWKDTRVLNRLQTRSAGMQFKYKLTRQNFQRWRCHVQQARMLQGLSYRADLHSKRRALFRLVLFTERKKYSREKCAYIEREVRVMRLQKALVKLVLFKIRTGCHREGLLRGENKLKKRVFVTWRHHASRRVSMRTARQFNRDFRLFKGLRKLVRQVCVASVKSKLEVRCRAFEYTRLISQSFHGWVGVVADKETGRAKAALATLFRSSKLLRKAFSRWHNITNYHDNLAAAFVMVQLHKLQGSTFEKWSAFATRWRRARKRLRASKRERHFHSWRAAARSSRVERQATCVAALYRRSNTLELYFGRWFQYLQTRRSKAKVDQLACLIANRRRLERNFATWQHFVMASKSLKAVRFHSLYITIRSFRRWKKMSVRANRRREHWRKQLCLPGRKQLRSTKPDVVSDVDIASYFFLLRRTFGRMVLGVQECLNEKLGLEMWRYLQYRKALLGWRRLVASNTSE